MRTNDKIDFMMNSSTNRQPIFLNQGVQKRSDGRSDVEVHQCLMCDQWQVEIEDEDRFYLTEILVDHVRECIASSVLDEQPRETQVLLLDPNDGLISQFQNTHEVLMGCVEEYPETIYFYADVSTQLHAWAGE